MADQPDPASGRLSALARTIVPNFVRRRYTLKFASILVVMALVVGGIGLTATGVVTSEVEGNIEKEQRDLATQKASVVEKWIERNAVSVKLASKNDALAETGGRSKYDIRGELATTGANLYGVNAVLLVSGSSEYMEVVASPQLPFGIDVSETSRAWLREVDVARMGVAEVHISDVYTVDGRPVIAFVSPVQGTENRYLVVEYDVGPLARSLQQADSGPGFTQVVDQNGRIQVATREAEINRQYGDKAALRPVELAQRLRGDPTQSAGVIAKAGPNPTVMDEPYTVGYAPVQVENAALDWVVLVHEPTRSVFGFPDAISRWGQLATLFGIFLIAGLGGAIGYSTTRDVRELRQLADEMRAGNLDVDIASTRIDSIGKLYTGFDDMRAELKRQIEEANSARREAERSRAEAIRMSEYLQEKAEEYSVTMEQCAAGDLTQRLDADGENEAMDRIARDFNAMISELETTTAQLKEFAAEVEVTGRELESSAESVRVSSEHITETVHTVSEDALDQKDRLDSLSEEIETLVTRFEATADAHDDLDIDQPLDQLSDIASQISTVAEVSERTFAETEIVAGAAETQATELSEVSDRSVDLTEYAEPLREVLEGFETDADVALGADSIDDDTEGSDGSVGRVESTD